MAKFRRRYPLNAPGKYYIDDMCLDCDLCRELAPNNVKRDDRTGQSYVFKQPENEDEAALLEKGGVRNCPTEAIGNDGDQFDWRMPPAIDWNKRYKGIQFEIPAPLVPIFKKTAE